MNVADPGLIIGAIDAAAIVGLSVYFNNNLTTLSEDIKKTKESIDTICQYGEQIKKRENDHNELIKYVKEKIDPKSFLELNNRMNEIIRIVNFLGENQQQLNKRLENLENNKNTYQIIKEPIYEKNIIKEPIYEEKIKEQIYTQNIVQKNRIVEEEDDDDLFAQEFQ